MTLPSKSFWEHKTVLVTGHTGFKGSWLSLCLSEMGAVVHGLALEPHGPKNLFSDLRLSDRLDRDFRVDIRDFTAVREAISQSQPDVIFHLAAQALVGEGLRSPLDTISTNVMGTANLLEACRQTSQRCVFISVTTDKVYSNENLGQVFGEQDSLGGKDPYSASKAAADIISQMFDSAYFNNREISVGVARAGNVIGGGDWNQDRIFPDIARAWSSGEIVKIRSPKATRPWQHVLEPLRGYMILAERLQAQQKISGPINFGPDPQDCLTVQELVSISSAFWQGNPGWDIEFEGRSHEVESLAISNSLASHLLGIEPVWTSEKAIERTTEWYFQFLMGANAETLCLADIQAYWNENE